MPSELKELFYKSVISRIKNDLKFFNFKDSNSLLQKLGFENDHRQSLAIRTGKKIESAVSDTIIEYANLHSINLKRLAPFITKTVAKKNHDGEQQIDYHFSRSDGNNEITWVVEIKTNPELDTGKQQSVVAQLENAYNIVRPKNNGDVVKLGYASLSYPPKSAQFKKMQKVKKDLLLRGIDCSLYLINSLMVETLDLPAAEFTDLELDEAIKEIGVYFRKELNDKRV